MPTDALWTGVSKIWGSLLACLGLISLASVLHGSAVGMQNTLKQFQRHAVDAG